MKMKNKGKVHPFTSSSSSSSTQNKDIFTVLKLLPTAIFALISVLSLPEREVLAYMITRSLKSTNPTQYKKNSSKKQFLDGHDHKSPALFDCDCFDCYTSFWFRWDSSPNRELIHQAIEAFDDHLNKGEQSKISGNGKNKRKEKMSRRKSESVGEGGGGGGVDFPVVLSPDKKDSVLGVVSEVNDVDEESGGAAAEAASVPVVVVHGHVGLARKVLPDVIGILNSRLWSLWSPNV
ncbi:hypothetical protein ACJIZ3_004614 [Penstemon smallii]|uniref:Uncharacterized protein n=1 Tax=Penstemon smallii TaxID=265156 RepID=A0ABD3S2I5_9LAMI